MFISYFLCLRKLQNMQYTCINDLECFTICNLVYYVLIKRFDKNVLVFFFFLYVLLYETVELCYDIIRVQF